MHKISFRLYPRFPAGGAPGPEVIMTSHSPEPEDNAEGSLTVDCNVDILLEESCSWWTNFKFHNASLPDWLLLETLWGPQGHATRLARK